ncbi:hypothetical protein D9M71_651950 [compost metagenome]
MGELSNAPDQVHAAGIHQLAQRRRVGQQQVARRHCIGEQGRDELGAGLLQRGEIGGLDEAIEFALAGQVALQEGAQQVIGLPGRIGEALVPGVRGNAGRATDDAAQLFQVTTEVLPGLDRRLAQGLEQVAGGGSQVPRAHTDQRVACQRVVHGGASQLLLLGIARLLEVFARAAASASGCTTLGGSRGQGCARGFAH